MTNQENRALGYAIEKFTDAVFGLATMPMTLQVRIEQVFVNNLRHVKSKELLDNDLSRRVEAVQTECQQKKGIEDTEATKLAKEIVEIAFALRFSRN